MTASGQSQAQRSLDLVFMGTPEYAAVSLRRLLAGPHRVRAVVTRADKARGRGHELRASPVKELALAAGIEVLDPALPRAPEFVARLADIAPDLGVVVAYGRILPPQVLTIPRLGCINAHGSLLPKLRGAAPIERAILAGYAQTGVTIMQMSEGLDEGAMLSARALAIGPQTTAGELRAAMAELSAQMLVEAVERYAAGEVTATPQDDAEATFAPPLAKHEAQIDWNEDADAVVRRVRAFAPQPGAFTFDGNVRLKVLVARVAAAGGVAGRGAGPAQAAREDGAMTAGTVLDAGASDGEGLLVACGRGVVELVSVQPEGRRSMSGNDYLRGRRASDPHRRLGGDSRAAGAADTTRRPDGGV